MFLLIISVLYRGIESLDQNHTDSFQAIELKRKPLKMMMLGHCEDVCPNVDNLLDKIVDYQHENKTEIYKEKSSNQTYNNTTNDFNYKKTEPL